MRVIESVIGPQYINQRLDNYLASRFTYLSRNQWQLEIREKRLLVNEKPVKPSYKLKLEDLIQYLPVDKSEPPVDPNYTIIYEDDWLVAVNKPGDLPCHPAGPYFQNTLLQLLKPEYGELRVLYRLDRETSGVIILAKSLEAAQSLLLQIRDRSVKKEYLLAVHGTLSETIHANGFLGHDPNSKIRKKRQFHLFSPNLAIEDDWETSDSTFYPLQQHDGLTLVRVTIKTGRQHQIRATAQSLGYPVVGDKLYGLNETYYLKYINDELTEADHHALRINNQALHAWKYTFFHPFLEKRITFTAPPPETFNTLMPLPALD